MPTVDHIRESIEARIAELRSEMATLQTARAELHQISAVTNEGDGAAATGAAVRAPKTATRAAPSKRTRRPSTRSAKAKKRVDVLPAGKLEAILGETERGLSASAIAKQSNAGYDQVLTLLRELERAGQVRRTGSRRTSLWRLISDEERIAERAAELRKLSASKS